MLADLSVSQALSSAAVPVRDMRDDIHRPVEAIQMQVPPPGQVHLSIGRLFVYVSYFPVAPSANPHPNYRSYRRSDVVQHITSKHPDFHLVSSSIRFDRALGTLDPPPSRERGIVAAVPPLDEENFLGVLSEAESLRGGIGKYLQERHESLRRLETLNAGPGAFDWLWNCGLC